MGLRILYIPFYTSKNLDGCSGFNNARSTIWPMIRDNEDVSALWLRPSPESGFEIPDHELWHHPRVHVVDMTVSREQERDIMLTPVDVLYKHIGPNFGENFRYDVVWNEKLRGAITLDLLLNNQLRGEMYSVPIVSAEGFPVDREGRFASFREPFAMATVLGATVGWNAWNCRSDMEMVLRYARQVVKPSIVERIIANSTFDLVIGMDGAKLRSYRIDKPRDVINVHFGSRISSHYGVDDIADTFDLTYRAGRKLKFFMTSPGGDNTFAKNLQNRIAPMGFPLETHYQCKQENYYRVASKCHVSLHVITQQGASQSMREQVALGQILVAPDQPVLREMFPDYPFLYRNASEMNAMFRMAVDEYWTDAVQAVVHKYQDLVLEMCDANAIRDRGLRFLRGVADTSREAVSPTSKEIIFEGLTMEGWPETLTYPDFMTMMQRHKGLGIKNYWKAMSRRVWCMALEECGYEMDPTSFAPLWRKIG